MHRATALALAATLAAPFVAAEGKPATCRLLIDGQDRMEGSCTFDAFDADGSFTVTAPDGRTFAYVIVTAPGVADGYWNGGAGASHAHDPLGVLLRDGACWANARATVCAW